MRRRIGLPSPALVIALIALFVALGGTSYAALRVTGKNVKNSSLTGKDVKNSSLSGSDIKNNSLTGSDVNESKLGTVPLATRAGSAGSAGTATTAGNGVKAYGSVTSAGAVIAAKSSGITVSPDSAAGAYCVRAAGLSSANRTLVATPDLGDGAGIDHTVQYDARSGPCTDSGGWRVLTFQAGAVTPIAFAVIIP